MSRSPIKLRLNRSIPPNPLSHLRQRPPLLLNFKKPGYPDFITEVTGVSGREDWGRWTDGATATFKFKDPLPKKFTLLVEAGAIGDNLGKPIKFRVGSVEKECVFKGDPFKGSRIATLHFNSEEPGNTLIATIPAPMNTPTDTSGKI